jgi:hypothetical protein
VTLVDRYVAEVARRLPRRRRADISRELRSTLLDTLESRFGAAAASDEHVVDVLREFGPPEKVAASYQPSNQYLIGPEWYGPFTTVVKLHLYGLVAVLVAGFAFDIFSPTGGTPISVQLSEVLASVFRIGLIAFGVIVLIFFLLERSDVRARKPVNVWNPRDLPDTPDHDLVGRGEALTIIIITAAYLVVLYQLQDRIGLYFNRRLLLNDIVRAYLPWLGTAALLTMLQYAVLLYQGRWHWYTRITKFACDAFGVFIVYRIAAAVLGEQNTLLDAGVPEKMVNVLMQVATLAPGVAAVLVLIDTIKTLWRSWSAGGRVMDSSSPTHFSSV